MPMPIYLYKNDLCSKLVSLNGPPFRNFVIEGVACQLPSSLRRLQASHFSITNFLSCKVKHDFFSSLLNGRKISNFFKIDVE